MKCAGNRQMGTAKCGPTQAGNIAEASIRALTVQKAATMQKVGFRKWLQAQDKPRGGPYAQSSIKTYIRDAERVEEHYGDLDELVMDKGRLDEVLGELKYTSEDVQRNAPNPSRIRIDPRKRKGYQSLNDYGRAVRKYREFRDSRGCIGQGP